MKDQDNNPIILSFLIAAILGLASLVINISLIMVSTPIFRGHMPENECNSQLYQSELGR